MPYQSIELTKVPGSYGFRLSEAGIIQVVTDTLGSKIIYTDPQGEGQRKEVVVSESLATITTRATILFTATINGTAIRLSSEWFSSVETITTADSILQTVIWYDVAGSNLERIVVDETEAAIHAAINAL